MKVISVLLALLLFAGTLTACTQTTEPEIVEEPSAPIGTLETGETTEPETVEEPFAPIETLETEETTEPETAYFTEIIPIKRPFEPVPGNVVMLSRSFQNTLIFTESTIWKTIDYWLFLPEYDGDVWQFTEPTRMMDSAVATDDIERVIENTHILTTDQTLYFLDFERGETVRQVENVTSTYHRHFGTMLNPLRYVRTADGSAWRVDAAEVQRLPDDVELFDGMPREETIPDAMLDLWFGAVRETSGDFVLTEDDVLWRFRFWRGDDEKPEIIMENVQSMMGGIITTYNELWALPRDNDEPHFIMENVQFSYGAIAITLDNEIWSVAHWWEDGEPFFIMENVKSVQNRFGFITEDDTLWWLPSWGNILQEYQPPVRVMENVLRTWWNWSGSEYILTLDGSLWLFDYKENYLVQIFQADVNLANAMERIAGVWDWPNRAGNEIYVNADGTWHHAPGDHGVRGRVELTHDGRTLFVEFIATEGQGPGIEGSRDSGTDNYDWVPHPDPIAGSFSGMYLIDYDRLIILSRWDDSEFEMKRSIL
jgi:hypothetical protein